MTFRILIGLVLSVAWLVGCRPGRDSAAPSQLTSAPSADPDNAIRAAIQAHLAHNGSLDLKSFDTDIKQVTVDGDRADAQVEFHVKNGPGTMQLTYALQNRDGVWTVSESRPLGSNFSHPVLDQRQPAAAGQAQGAESSVFRILDSLRDRPVKPSKNLPPGHPPVALPKKAESKTP